MPCEPANKHTHVRINDRGGYLCPATDEVTSCVRNGDPETCEHCESMKFYVTSAPEAYDGFGSKTVAPDCGVDNRGIRLRLVAVADEMADWQLNRYASGLHSVCTLAEARLFPTIYRLNPTLLH
jgi:hypothetical protein